MSKFSLVIPTKNRASILSVTIDHICRQTFKDFECVIIDNDDSDETLKVYDSKKLPSNFRYVRTGGLSMPDNWQKAVDEARGKYLIILEDKTIIKYNMLGNLNFIFSNQPECHCITWRQCVARLETLSPDKLQIQNPQLSRISSEDIINIALDSNWHSFGVFAPRGFNSAISLELAKGGILPPEGFRICQPMSPDYSLAFQSLILTNFIIHLTDCATIINADSPSNGFDAHKKGKLFQSFINEIGVSENEFLEFSRSKVFSVHNFLTSDALRIFSCFKSTKKLQFSLSKYYLNISYETVFRSIIGCQVQPDIDKFRDEISMLPRDVRNEIIELCKINHSDFCARWGISDVYKNNPGQHIRIFFDT
jgi:glycosyltransferase involved in cell wall biosynthesis